jgi:adenosylhomocysteine nucleosidase
LRIKNMHGTPLAGIIIATRLEAGPFIKAFNMQEVEDRPFLIYACDEIILAISGIGKANAAMTTAYVCTKFDPEWIINLGAAGATQESREMGSIYQIERVFEPDRPHLGSKTPYVQIPALLPGFQKAVLATQDKAVEELETFRQIAPLADLVDMEGASVVQASRKFGKRCLLFKFVSDTPVHAGQGEVIIEHIKNYSDPFCGFIFDSVIPVLKGL